MHNIYIYVILYNIFHICHHHCYHQYQWSRFCPSLKTMGLITKWLLKTCSFDFRITGVNDSTWLDAKWRTIQQHLVHCFGLSCTWSVDLHLRHILGARRCTAHVVCQNVPSAVTYTRLPVCKESLEEIFWLWASDCTEHSLTFVDVHPSLFGNIRKQHWLLLAGRQRDLLHSNHLNTLQISQNVFFS